MKTRLAVLFLAAFALFTPACEQHKWEETQKLFKEGEHGEAKGEHGKAEGHAAAKPADEKKH